MKDPSTFPRSGTGKPAFEIRKAVAADVPAILELIRGLGDYERLAHEVVANEALLESSLFGDRPAAEVLIGFQDGDPAGFALFFQNYSTFLGRAGIYLEDLYVKPDFRGRGLGRMLLSRVAAVAVERRCARMEWCVLDWNEPAIRFYRNLGARPLEDWTLFRLTGRRLEELAGG